MISGLTKSQIIALAGFFILLVSIPVSFSLVKQSQIFSSRASEKKSDLTRVATTSATTPRPVPSNSPLTDLQKLIQESNLSPTPTAETTGNSAAETSINLAFGPTLNFSVTLEGRPKDKQASKAFVGIASGTTALSPTYILTFTVDIPNNGIFKGLSLAGLNSGSIYTVYIKGAAQIDSSLTFTMDPSETNLNEGKALALISGDLNEDNVINSADYTIARNLYGTTPSSANWNERADFNRDNIINNWDLLYINNNFGKIGSSGTWISTPAAPLATSSANLLTKPNIGGPPLNFGDLLYQSNSSTSATTDTTPPTSGYWLWVP